MYIYVCVCVCVCVRVCMERLQLYCLFELMCAHMCLNRRLCA